MEGDADERAEVAAAPDATGVTAATAAAQPPPAAAPATTAATTQTNIAADGVVALPAPAAAAAPARSHPNEADPPTAKDVPERVGEHQQQNGETEKATTKTDADDADAAGAPPPQPPLDDEALLASFFAEVKSADRDAEVNRILGAFKLNPYEQLGVRFDADAGEVARAYRKSSLLVHEENKIRKCRPTSRENVDAAILLPENPPPPFFAAFLATPPAARRPWVYVMGGQREEDGREKETVSK